MKKAIVLLGLCLGLHSTLRGDIFYNCFDSDGAEQTMTFLKSDIKGQSVFGYATKGREISFELKSDKFSISNFNSHFVLNGQLEHGGESSFSARFPEGKAGTMVFGTLQITDIVGEHWVMPEYFNCQIIEVSR